MENNVVDLSKLTEKSATTIKNAVADMVANGNDYIVMPEKQFLRFVDKHENAMITICGVVFAVGGVVFELIHSYKFKKSNK